MLNSRPARTQGEEENISPSLEASEINVNQSSVADFNPNEISVKEVFISKTEPQFIGIKFIIDGIETERFIEPDSLWYALQNYFRDHLISAKTYVRSTD